MLSEMASKGPSTDTCVAMTTCNRMHTLEGLSLVKIKNSVEREDAAGRLPAILRFKVHYSTARQTPPPGRGGSPWGTRAPAAHTRSHGNAGTVTTKRPVGAGKQPVFDRPAVRKV